MTPLLIKVAIAATATGTYAGLFDLAAHRESITLINTFLNGASWYLLIQAQRKLRTEVTPKLDHVEETVTAIATQNAAPPAHAIEGGRRHYDPSSTNPSGFKHKDEA